MGLLGSILFLLGVIGALWAYWQYDRPALRGLMASVGMMFGGLLPFIIVPELGRPPVSALAQMVGFLSWIGGIGVLSVGYTLLRRRQASRGRVIVEVVGFWWCLVLVPMIFGWAI